MLDLDDIIQFSIISLSPRLTEMTNRTYIAVVTSSSRTIIVGIYCCAIMNNNNINKHQKSLIWHLTW